MTGIDTQSLWYHKFNPMPVILGLFSFKSPCLPPCPQFSYWRGWVCSCFCFCPVSISQFSLHPQYLEVCSAIGKGLEKWCHQSNRFFYFFSSFHQMLLCTSPGVWARSMDSRVMNLQWTSETNPCHSWHLFFFFFTPAPSNHQQRICRILRRFTITTASILVQLLYLLTESLQVSLIHFPVSLSEQQPVIPLKMNLGSSLVAHWLRLHTPNAGSLGLIPGQGSLMQQLKDPACCN